MIQEHEKNSDFQVDPSIYLDESDESESFTQDDLNNLNQESVSQTKKEEEKEITTANTQVPDPNDQIVVKDNV